ncbi:hypothetical protein IAQ61_002865 [Plenodomus lingam]|uniref:uncharacterized protein n=1 Tax=Leptosphaeria maculans TaxID=5022 RepID=UPI003322F024|nr:hypothetical protein IAQ61_002865 [Plenodomus lingam]
MANVTANAGAPPPPPPGPSPSQIPTSSQRVTCTRHPARELTVEEITAGYTRCLECRTKNHEGAMKRRKLGDLTIRLSVEPGIPSHIPRDFHSSQRRKQPRTILPIPINAITTANAYCTFSYPCGSSSTRIRSQYTYIGK